MSIPRSEHPRPEFERSNWMNLNGEWEFEVDADETGFEKRWTTGHDFSQKIVVPFCPESSLSGIGEKDFMESVWYRRFFDVPERWLEGRALLHFGAVDYQARVYVNSRQVGYHRGGYTPFTCDISDVVNTRENELVVWARDNCRSELQATGKQSHRLEPYRDYYTRVTGIWQTVWLESVPRVYIPFFHVITDPYNGKVFIRVHTKGQREKYDLSLAIWEGKLCVAEAEFSFYRSPAEITSIVPSPRAWSPEDPFLYGLKLRLADENGSVDAIESYLAFREIHTVGNRILFNNETRFLRFVLDQGYYPEGIYTAPSDEYLKRDIEIAKAMGFDGARLHQKIFEPRFLYWADRLGYLAAGEFPDLGVDLSRSCAREALLDEWIEVVRRDLNHPCIIMWTPFNERELGVGKPCTDFVRRVVHLTRLLDPTRPVIDSSGYTHVETDIYDIHDYEQNVESFRVHYASFESLLERAGRQDVSIDLRFETPSHVLRNAPYEGQPIIVSEYGGTWWRPEGTENGSWGYGGKPKSLEELISRYKALTESLISNPYVSGFSYTQLYDIERETNGLHTYDRKPKVDPEVVGNINKQEAALEVRYRRN